MMFSRVVISATRQPSEKCSLTKNGFFTSIWIMFFLIDIITGKRISDSEKILKWNEILFSIIFIPSYLTFSIFSRIYTS